MKALLEAPVSGRLRLPQGGGLRGPQTATPGGSITVNVGPNDSSIQVTDPTTQNTTTHKVEPGKDTTIPMPNAPGGTMVRVQIGKGLNAQFLVVELQSTGP
ncbi:MAG: hypothetical protein KDC98_25295 [Planctomycetes bacterium]|nr:hypothetical protein [Planctomycetota bacterium]